MEKQKNTIKLEKAKTYNRNYREKLKENGKYEDYKREAKIRYYRRLHKLNPEEFNLTLAKIKVQGKEELYKLIIDNVDVNKDQQYSNIKEILGKIIEN